MFRRTLVATLRQWPLLLLLFLLTLLPALPPALGLLGTLNSEADGSLALQQLLPGFNYTVFVDFMHEHGDSIWSLVRTGLWTAVASLLLRVWTKGGILYSFANGFQAESFWRAGTQYMRPNLRLLGTTALWGLVWLLTLLLTTTLLVTLLTTATPDVFTERGYTLIGLLVGGLFILALVYLFCIAQYASVFLYTTEPITSRAAFHLARNFIALNRRKTFGSYLLFVLIGTGLFGLYFLLESLFTADGWLLIGGLFLLQQGFIFSRIALTTWSLRLAYENTLTLPMPIRLFLPAPRTDQNPPVNHESAQESTADSALILGYPTTDRPTDNRPDASGSEAWSGTPFHP